MKKKILQILYNNKNSYQSGEIIAKTIGISRNAIWKHINSLRKDGYNILAKPNCGYMLFEDDLMLSDYLIRKHLKNDFIKEVTVLKTCNSTSTRLKEIASLSPIEGTLLISNSQDIGKGRQGRKFFSPKDIGLYFSIVLKPFTIDLITSFIAVAVSNAIDKLYNIDTKIKWVNDIYYNDKKICGILTEGQIEIESQSPSYLIVGIGINVNNTKIPIEIENIATSLFLETNKKINRLVLLGEILNNISEYKQMIDSKDFLKIYKEKMFLINSRIKFTRNNEIFYGKVLDVDKNCSLIILTDENKTINLNSGEVHIIADACLNT